VGKAGLAPRGDTGVLTALDFADGGDADDDDDEEDEVTVVITGVECDDGAVRGCVVDGGNGASNGLSDIVLEVLVLEDEEEADFFALLDADDTACGRVDDG
jgi:hypothetical protein